MGCVLVAKNEDAGFGHEPILSITFDVRTGPLAGIRPSLGGHDDAFDIVAPSPRSGGWCSSKQRRKLLTLTLAMLHLAGEPLN